MLNVQSNILMALSLFGKIDASAYPPEPLGIRLY
jgi:hypothetical protein